MAASAEHDGNVGKAEPIAVVQLEALDQCGHEGIMLAGHHEADGEACGMGRGCDEIKTSKRSERASALQIHI